MKIAYCFFIIGVFFFIFFAVFHEQVHVQIYRFYGIDSKVDYIKHFPNFATIPERDCNNESCFLAHSINESVGYHLGIFYILVLFGFFSIVLVLEENRIERRLKSNGKKT